MTDYAKETEVKAGTVLIADGGFTCIKEGAELTVQDGPSGLFVPCDCGTHSIDGQLDDGEVYIGLSLKRAT